MADWILKRKGGNFAEIGAKHGINPVIARLLVNRNLSEEDIAGYLCADENGLHSPFLMKGMENAVRLIKETIVAKRRIRIIGDYDVDGVSSTFILYDMLKQLGAGADYYIPDRVSDGYGINEAIVRTAAADGISLLLTCDNGISAKEQIALAYRLGMKVIVTDHHEIPAQIPEAEAVLNPKLEECGYPYRELCGAAVALKLTEALYCEPGEDRKPDIFRKYADIAAMATVCDIVPLTGENRCIVKQGLKKLRENANPGLKILMERNNLQPKNVGAYQLGYTIGPCINASGRLETAEIGMQLLTEERQGKAEELADLLIELNEERKRMTREAVEEAEAQLPEEPADTVLVQLLSGCHESIAGIVAGRIREKYNRPSIILTHGQECIKGSARSTEFYNIAEELKKCSDILLAHGGHPMAAGLSLKEEYVVELSGRLNRQSKITAEQLKKKILIDMELPLEYVNETLYEELKVLEPFGNQNPMPVFAVRNLSVLHAKRIGKEQQYLKLRLMSPNGTEMDALWFNDRELFEREVKQKYGEEELQNIYCRRPNHVQLSIIYDIDINEYMGIRSVQLLVRDYKLT